MDGPESPAPTFRTVTLVDHAAVAQVVATLEAEGIPALPLDTPSADTLWTHVNAKVRIAVPESRLEEAAAVLARAEGRDDARLKTAVAKADRAVFGMLFLGIPVVVATVWLAYRLTRHGGIALLAGLGVTVLGFVLHRERHSSSGD